MVKPSAAPHILVVPGDIKWELHDATRPTIDKIRNALRPEIYDADKRALRQFLCDYFNSDTGKDCSQKQGKSVSPVGVPCDHGAKTLKVRWAYPGQGKSGGLRLAVAAFCKDRHVKVVGAWIRRDDPTNDEFAAAFRA